MSIRDDALSSTIAVYDIETPFITSEGSDALTQIYCIAVTVIDNGVIQPSKLFTETWQSYSDGSLMEGIELINSCKYTGAHNGMSFDAPVISNVLSTDITPIPLDTLIISKLLYSSDELIGMDAKLDIPKNLWGSYSLKAFGYRLGNYKIQFEEFDEGLTEQMGIYCKQDADLTADLLLHLFSGEYFPNDEVITLEHKAASIIAKQESYGFYFDIDKARILNSELLAEKLAISQKLVPLFRPKLLPDGRVATYKKPMKSRRFLPNTNYKDPWK